MKRYLTVLATLLVALSAAAQTERVFVQTDRSAYLSGERVWCSLFCVDQNGLLSAQSAVAYLELVSADGTAVEAKIGLLAGRGCGEFSLPAHIPTGNYRLMAYTSLEGAAPAKAGSRILSVYNSASLARVTDGVVLEKQAFSPLPEEQRGLELSVPAKVRQGRPFTLLVKGPQADISLSVYHEDGLEQQAAPTLQDFLEGFPVDGTPGGNAEYEGEVIRGLASGAPDRSMAILSCSGSADDTYLARVNGDGRMAFVTGNIYGKRELVCELWESDSDARIRLLSPFRHPSAGEMPQLVLFEEQYGALAGRKNALQVPYPLDTLVRFLPRREDQFLSGVQWETYHLDDYTRFPSVQEVLVEIVHSVHLRRRSGKPVLEVAIPDAIDQHITYKDYILVMMDGVVVTDVNLILDFDAMLLQDVCVCREPVVSGGNLFNGIVNFVTKKNYVTALKFADRVSVVDFNGVRYPVAYPGGVVPGVHDNRQLLCWQPALQTSTGENLRIPLVAPAYSGTFCIVAEGLDASGRPVRAVTRFQVD